ncbi:LOW QUALITY PROTEIN: aspartic proteinase CDR1-like protein [Cinnamomum micranthum f. kanehirae]|uniref:Aspartic proteinase CDR1-like protein n=1 Tax=Cinnamomum micranthum f. kanehirae TaxID=337451 RepID=A0A443P897_9MAGN|nr:LOW QUALITY PROTEIN: aspartic proteinase CDR1-like protein [Cinnamomum micranthum f. kanehirae]
MYSNGVLAAETLTMMASSDADYVNLPNITFGCSSHYDNNRTGVVSLGGKKFSYCFLPYNQNASSSRIHFGDSAVVSGTRSLYTPLVLKPVSNSIIYVTLEYISVGDQSVFLPSIEKGNTIMDSGTTLTYLPTQAYILLLSVLKGAIDLAPVQDPSNNFDLCYEYGKDFNVPDLKFGFDGGDELLLGPLNTFVPVDENVTCAAFFGLNSVVGSIAQQNIKIGYDFDDMVVAFQPTDCAHDQ